MSFDAVALTDVGALGAVVAGMGVSGLLSADAEGVDTPLPLTACTVTEYTVPSVTPAIEHDDPADTQVKPPGLAVAKYPETGDPGVEGESVHCTWSDDPRLSTLTPVGASGTPEGTMGSESADEGPNPAAFLPFTEAK